MKPELLIWDWNGTILDDALVCRNIANIMLSERGIPTLPDMDAYRAVFGFPIKSYYEKMGYRFGPEDEPYEHVADEFIIWYDKLYRTALLRPGIVPFLDRLKGEGYRQVLLSATRYQGGPRQGLHRKRGHSPGKDPVHRRHGPRLRGVLRHRLPLRAPGGRPPEPSPARSHGRPRPPGSRRPR